MAKPAKPQQPKGKASKSKTPPAPPRKTPASSTTPTRARVRDGDRVAIVWGLRTPFARSGTAFADLTALDLGKAVVSEIVARSEIDPKQIDQLVYGQVLPSLVAPNVAREIVLGTGLPRTIEAYSVSRACATSLQALASVAEAIGAGSIDVAIAGGTDSASDVPISVSKPIARALVDAQKGKTLGDKLRAFRAVRPRDIVPVPPALTELSTGLTMGESAERMAKENGIGREDQDAVAHRSHVRAAKAWADGVFADEVMHLIPGPRYDGAVTEDNNVRKDSTLEGYAKLRPAFDRKWGTVTAGNSSPLTDGASALLVMREAKARALGYEPLGYLRSWAFAGLDPGWQLLMGPAIATPLALDRAGLTLRDMTLVDMHEAFGVQVLSNLQAFASKKFAEERLGRSSAIGEVDMDRFNVHGGSIAVGHPFAATAARMVTTTLRELRSRGGGFALVTLCAAGGLGAAAVLEAA